MLLAASNDQEFDWFVILLFKFDACLLNETLIRIQIIRSRSLLDFFL